MKIEYLDHTADTKFRAYGKNLEEQFTNAAFALFGVMVETKTVKSVVTMEIKVFEDDLPGLLYAFLEKLIIMLDANNFFLSRVNSLVISGGKNGFELAARVSGDDAGKYETIGPQVKAVTFNDMKITKEYVQVVLDI